jgi:hypothetical protein
MTILEKKSILPEKMENYIYNTLTSKEFPWYYRDNISYTEVTPRNINEYGFVHMIDYYGNATGNGYLDSFNDLIKSTIPIFEKEFNIQYSSIGRIRIGLQTKVSESSVLYKPHTDSRRPHSSVIYYVNDSDGDTIFYKGQSYQENVRIKPEKGKAICFNDSLFHGGSSPVVNSKRIVINFLFRK